MTLIEALKVAYEYHDKPLTDNVMRVWTFGLTHRGIDHEVAAAAIMQTLTESKYLPKLADIVERVQGNDKDTAENDAQAAFIKVWDAIGKVGPYNPVVFDDLKIHAALGNSGWLDLMDATMEQKGTIRAQFVRAYKGVKVSDQTPRVLSAKHSGKPKLIGDPLRCKAIMAEARKITGPREGVDVSRITEQKRIGV
jgi:hypothetical protein